VLLRRHVPPGPRGGSRRNPVSCRGAPLGGGTVRGGSQTQERFYADAGRWTPNTRMGRKLACRFTAGTRKPRAPPEPVQQFRRRPRRTGWQNPMHLYGITPAHGPSGLPWRAAPHQWPLSHRCSSVCIGGSKCLLRREPHSAAGEAGHHRKQNPMHLYEPASAYCSPSQAAQPHRARLTKTPCTCSARPTAHRRLRQRQSSQARLNAGLSSAKSRTPCTNSRRRLFGNTPCPADQHPMPSEATPHAQREIARPRRPPSRPERT
jgi:hypothetical protein